MPNHMVIDVSDLENHHSTTMTKLCVKGVSGGPADQWVQPIPHCLRVVGRGLGLVLILVGIDFY